MEMNENPLKIENIYVIYFWICLDKNLLFFYENYNHKIKWQTREICLFSNSSSTLWQALDYITGIAPEFKIRGSRKELNNVYLSSTSNSSTNPWKQSKQ